MNARTPIWLPSPSRIAAANLTKFIEQASKLDSHVCDFDSLYQWSITRPAAFWDLLWTHCNVIADRADGPIVDDIKRMPGAKWFANSRLNFAENLLRIRDDSLAIISWGENGRLKSLSYAELAEQVARIAAALERAGVTMGDRVVGFLPNIPEAIVAMLAAASLGAVWSSTSPDFGLPGVLDRFGQISPKVLFAVDGYYYNGKKIDTISRVNEIVSNIASIETVVIIPFLDPSFSQGVTWDDFALPTDRALRFQRWPFDHPLCILYSSGTTGVPKCMVHGAGGTLLQHLKELVLHTDLKPSDRIFYFTTCGWMMWNWLISSLAVGATVVLYDGSPGLRDGNILFDMIDEEEISIFGTSAKFLSTAEKQTLCPMQSHRLTSLRTILSTGSPLSPESFEYVYREIKLDVCLSSISGGSDIVSCFALGNPIGPVYSGQLQVRGLGMDVQVWDDQGNSVVGQKGELICASAFPSMPTRFWNDPEGEKYQAAYFEHFPNVWRHGDYVMLTEQGGVIVYGRSDAVLNPGGVRIGTAEIIRQVETFDEVLESVVVGQEWEDDVRVILFVKLREGCLLDDELTMQIKQRIRQRTTPRHVPAKVIAVADIPRTISGKIVEVAIRETIHGRPIGNRDALANPQALLNFANLDQLKV
jgi:acetoacetyl-CoA synthetase